MKSKILLLALVFTASASATVNIQGNYGELFNSSGTVVGNNTLFVLVASSTGTFAGGFTVNTTLGEVGANSAFTSGQSLSLNGTLGTGGTIFAIGGTNGPVAEAVLGLTLGGNFATNNNYAVYWFPGSTYGGGSTGTVGSQVGGFNTTTGAPSFSLGGMIVPADGADVSQGFVTVSGGGVTPNASLFAVNLIPEPSAALLGALGALVLLRRRRN